MGRDTYQVERRKKRHTMGLLGEDEEWWVVMIGDVVHWNTTHIKRERKSSIIVCDNPTTMKQMFDLFGSLGV